MSTSELHPELPVDRGWAWLVMLGAMINCTFGYGFLRSLSILFMEFLDKFGESAAMTTLAFCLNTAAASIFSFLLPYTFLSRFSVRTVTLAGSLINAFSIIALAFAPNMIFIYFLFIAIGAACPMIFVAQVALLGVYFKKRLSLAMAIANIGVSIATIVSPPLTRYLLDEYGLQGTLLIHGALNLHNFAACLLFRPLSYYIKTRATMFDLDEDRDTTKDTQDKYEPGHINLDLAVSISKERFENTNNSVNDHLLVETEKDKNEDNVYISNAQCIFDRNPRKSKSLHDLLYTKFSDDKSRDTSKSRSVTKLYDTSETTRIYTKRVRNIDESNSSLIHKYLEFHSQMMKSNFELTCSCSSTMVINDIALLGEENCPLREDFDPNLHTFMDMKKETLVSETKSGDGYCCRTLSKLTIDKSSPLFGSRELLKDSNTAKLEETEKEMDKCGKEYDNLEVSCDSHNGENECCSFCVKSSISTSSKGTLKNSVCFHPLGIMLLLMSGFGIHTQCAAAYIPSLGKEQGVADDKTPLLMTVVGICDLFKLAIGHLGDMRCIRRIYIILGCQLLLGVMFQFTSFFQGFTSMVIFSVIFGSNSEALHVLLPVVTVDFLGVHYISEISSLYFLLNGIVMSVTHVLVGLFKDESGSFVGGYHFMGGLQLFSAVIIILESVFHLFSRRVPNTKDNTTNHNHCCCCPSKCLKDVSNLTNISNAREISKTCSTIKTENSKL